MKRDHSYLSATSHALLVLGAQIALARRELGWTASRVAGRLGVDPRVVTRTEKGSSGVAVGTVFEAAIVCGLPLFAVEAAQLGDLADRELACSSPSCL